MDIFRRDLVLAVRGLRQAPGVTAAVVVMLALAIGATAGVSSVVHAALRRPLPYFDVDRWADLYERPINEGLENTLSVSIPNYRDWRDGSRAFTAMVLWRPWSFNLAGDDQAPERLRATIVTPNLFAALRLVPAAGRLLQDGDDPLDRRVVFISHRLWQRRYGGDPAIVGQADPPEPRAAHRGRRGARRVHLPARRPGRRVGPGLHARHRERHLPRRARHAGVGAAPRRRHVGRGARATWTASPPAWPPRIPRTAASA